MGLGFVEFWLLLLVGCLGCGLAGFLVGLRLSLVFRLYGLLLVVGLLAGTTVADGLVVCY